MYIFIQNSLQKKKLSANILPFLKDYAKKDILKTDMLKSEYTVMSKKIERSNNNPFPFSKSPLCEIVKVEVQVQVKRKATIDIKSPFLLIPVFYCFLAFSFVD